MFIVTPFQLFLGIFCFIFTIASIVALFFFGKLMKHQFKVWLLARRGYVQIRHVREDMNEDYYFLKFRDNHYNFGGGVYMEQKDTKTNTSKILPVFDYNLLKQKKKEGLALNAQEEQLLSFFNNIKDNKIMDIKTLPWGMPTITYFGTDPQPINFRDRKKIYDAKNIAAMIKRILMTKEWKLVRIAIIIGCVAIVGLLVLGFLNYTVSASNSKNLAICQQSLNISINSYIELVNKTIAPLQNTTITI